MFGGPAASFGWRWDGRRLDQGLGSNVLGQKVGVLPEAIARTLDLDNDGVVKKPVKGFGCRPDECRCQVRRGPASESLQGRKPRWGNVRRYRGRYGDLSGARAVCELRHVDRAD
jgi:hypothetical protein